MVVMKEDVTVDLHHTMKLNKMEEIMDTTMLLLHNTMSIMIVDSTDQTDHRFRQLLK